MWRCPVIRGPVSDGWPSLAHNPPTCRTSVTDFCHFHIWQNDICYLQVKTPKYNCPVGLYSDTTMDEMISGSGGVESVHQPGVSLSNLTIISAPASWTRPGPPTRRWRTARSSTLVRAQCCWWWRTRRRETSLSTPQPSGRRGRRGTRGAGEYRENIYTHLYLYSMLWEKCFRDKEIPHIIVSVYTSGSSLPRRGSLMRQQLSQSGAASGLLSKFCSRK